jgi:hypothetical protein
MDGGRSFPPERNDGHRDLSSGREVPVDEEGERWERIAAACEVLACQI